MSESDERIVPELLSCVFDRFRQSDATPDRCHGGLGPSRAIVKQLVELHGRTVQAKITGVGQGMVFVVHLSLAAIREQTSREHSLLPKTPQLGFSAVNRRGVMVLIADAEPDARELVRRVFTPCNAKAIVADKALLRLKAEKPDIIVSDIGVPGNWVQRSGPLRVDLPTFGGPSLRVMRPVRSHADWCPSEEWRRTRL